MKTCQTLDRVISPLLVCHLQPVAMDINLVIKHVNKSCSFFYQSPDTDLPHPSVKFGETHIHIRYL